MALTQTPVCDFGRAAPDFSLATPAGEWHSLDSLKGPKGLFLAFICNHCPYVIAIAERMVADFTALQSEGIGVAAIMSNDYAAYPADAPAKMVDFAEKYGFTFPYLVDETQSVAKAYNAVCTPDFFGFDANGGLQYRGRLDDAQMGDPSNRTPELLTAMLAVAKGERGPDHQTPSMGCSIKWAH